MSDDRTVFGECRRCGDDATLSVAHPDGVFRDVCMPCYLASLRSGYIDAFTAKLRGLTQILTRI